MQVTNGGGDSPKRQVDKQRMKPEARAAGPDSDKTVVNNTTNWSLAVLLSTGDRFQTLGPPRDLCGQVTFAYSVLTIRDIK